jgi:CheY-like chemotaxis protein
MATILVLDDNADIVSLLRMVLSAQGHTILTGRNGREGLEILEQNETHPDLIISNFYMPLMNGMEFLEHIRATPDYAAIPFIMITAAPSMTWLFRATELGANGFVTKPFRLETLRNAIRSLGFTS